MSQTLTIWLSANCEWINSGHQLHLSSRIHHSRGIVSYIENNPAYCKTETIHYQLSVLEQRYAESENVLLRRAQRTYSGDILIVVSGLQWCDRLVLSFLPEGKNVSHK